MIYQKQNFLVSPQAHIVRNLALLFEFRKLNIEKKNTIEPVFHEILHKFTDIFEGHGKLKSREQNHEGTLAIDETVSPVQQKMHLQPYHIQKAINEELRRLESLDKQYR